MKQIKWMIVLVALIVLVSQLGCAMGIPRVTAEQIANADYGSRPDDYQSDIKKIMSGHLKDPDSAKYNFSCPPLKGYAFINGDSKPPLFGYIIMVRVNAKNSFGGYVGEKNYAFLFYKQNLYPLYPLAGVYYFLSPPSMQTEIQK